MPRPENVSDEDIVSWDESFNSSGFPNVPVLRECWRAGCYVRRELQAAGATENDIEAAQFAHGQRCYVGDPWSAADLVVSKWKAGTPDKPGLELAAQLISEKIA